MSLDICIHI